MIRLQPRLGRNPGTRKRLRGASPRVHDELVQILGIITDGIQELGWYSHDLEEIADAVDRLPGLPPDAQQRPT